MNILSYYFKEKERLKGIVEFDDDKVVKIIHSISEYFNKYIFHYELTSDNTLYFIILHDIGSIHIEIYFGNEDENEQSIIIIYKEKECEYATVCSLEQIFYKIENYVIRI